MKNFSITAAKIKCLTFKQWPSSIAVWFIIRCFQLRFFPTIQASFIRSFIEFKWLIANSWIHCLQINLGEQTKNGTMPACILLKMKRPKKKMVTILCKEFCCAWTASRNIVKKKIRNQIFYKFHWRLTRHCN